MLGKKYMRVWSSDGFNMSVQAHEGAYCEPREDNQDLYSEVEVGYPSEVEPMLMPYAEQWVRGGKCNATKTVYAYVPAHLVLDVIAKHGGQVRGELPPLDLSR